MSIQISLPPEMEARLIAEANACGKEVEALVVETIEARLSLSELGLRDILAPVHAEFEESGMTDAELESLLDQALAESRKQRKADSGSAA